MKTVIALYDSWETADAVIEALLDYGFSHANITVMSGDHWKRESGAEYVASAVSDVSSQGNQALLKLHATGYLGEIARGLICNSGALDVHELEGEDEVETLTTPLAVSMPQASMM